MAVRCEAGHYSDLKTPRNVVGCFGSPEEVAGRPDQPVEAADHITGGIAGDVAEREKAPEEEAPATSRGG